MAERFSISDKLVLFEVETTPGTGETPTVSADAIQVESPTFSINGEVDSGENEVTSSLDAGNPVPQGVAAACNFGVRLKGVASPCTTPPRWGRLLQAAACLQTLTAAVVTGTATAGAANTITTTGESSTDDAYNGMVMEITDGTGAGQVRVIFDYVGSTGIAHVYPDWETEPDNTSVYEIRANALYKPTSLDQKTGTLWFYDHANQSSVNSILRKIVGGCGAPSLEIPNRGIARLQYNFQGLLPEDPSDVTRPTAPTYDSGDPQPFLNAEAYLGGAAVQFNRFSLNFNNQIAQPDDPAAENGLDYCSVTSRRLDATLVANLRNMATRNAVTAFKAGTSQKLWLNWGTGTGKRISLFAPDVRYISPPGGENVNGFTYESLSLRLNGLDTGVYLCIH